ncbi:MAG TPA: HTH domain-containing protein [Clostridiales bacterium]|nr:HTH domain-containing protein [Clostridiales bacterium]
MIESNRLEFKSELNSKLEKEVVGFLNSQEGGAIYIGVDDNGVPIGIEDIDKTQLKTIDRIKDGILPSTLGLFDVRIKEEEGLNTIKITISSGTEKPYYIKKLGMSPNGCYVRVGNATHPMTVDMIDDLYSRRIRNSLYKIQSPTQNLTFAQLKIYYEEKGFELNKSFAKNLELLTDHGKYNYNAYLFSDNNGLSMKVAKYSGTNKIDLIENEEYGYCSIIKAAYSILDKLEIENTTKTKITSKARIEKRLVDNIALREAVINAIVHNDYSREIPPVVEIFSDRIMITSTGSLPQALSKQEFLSGISAPRNKEIMRIFKDIQLVEHLGSGVTRILEKYDESVFDITPNFMRVTFMFEEDNVGRDVGKDVGKDVGNKINTNIKLSKNQNKILLEISKNNKITQKELALLLKVTERTIQRNMITMQQKGMLKRIGPTFGGYWEIV